MLTVAYMRSVVLALALVVGSLAACSAPTVADFPGATDTNTQLPNRTPTSSSDDSNSSSNATGTQTTTSADTGPGTASTLALTVSSTGDGTGNITSSPAGVTCTGKSCSGNFASGTSVTLTAAPQAGSIFVGWSGGGCSGTSTCVTTVSSAATVQAQFITLAGTWSGTYTHNESNGICNFANAGNLTNTMASSDGTTFTTAAQANGFQIKDDNCDLEGTVNGAAGASAATVSGATITGTWDMQLDQGFGDLPLPFTATISGNQMTGKWTCNGCTGGFTITKSATGS